MMVKLYNLNVILSEKYFSIHYDHSARIVLVEVIHDKVILPIVLMIHYAYVHALRLELQLHRMHTNLIFMLGSLN